MNNYIIFTDSACDIDINTLKDWGIEYLELSFMFDGEDKQYYNYDLPSKEFYGYMREGKVAKTSAANVAAFKEAFEKTLKEGNDILYLGFSSGLSTTCNSAKIAAEELSEIYPDNKIITIDTLAASAGQGLLVYLANEKKKSGDTIDEVADYVKSNIPNVCHWFTVDDLVYLKRGGRVSPAVAFVGGILGIKPILHVDDEGRLINMDKVRGRKAALKTLVDKYGQYAINKGKDDVVFLCHADCIEDTQDLSKMLKEEYDVTVQYVADVGPVIGAHAGPGTIAIFFLGEQK